MSELEFQNRHYYSTPANSEISLVTVILGSFKHAINRIIICPINLFIKSFFARKLD